MSDSQLRPISLGARIDKSAVVLAQFSPVTQRVQRISVGPELASCNSIVIYVPSRANRRVQGIGIQHRPGMRNRNLFSFPFPIPLSATQIFYYFPVEPVCSPLSLCPSPLHALSPSPSLSIRVPPRPSATLPAPLTPAQETLRCYVIL